MNSWLLLWTCLLVVGATVFAVLALMVARGAAKDIKSMFQDLGEKSGNDRESPSDRQ